MNDMSWIAFLGLIAAWFALNTIILPRLGVPT